MRRLLKNVLPDACLEIFAAHKLLGDPSILTSNLVDPCSWLRYLHIPLEGYRQFRADNRLPAPGYHYTIKIQQAHLQCVHCRDDHSPEGREAWQYNFAEHSFLVDFRRHQLSPLRSQWGMASLLANRSHTLLPHDQSHHSWRNS